MVSRFLTFISRKKNLRKQRELLNREIEEWRGDLEQIDDICVMGVRI
jgi:hypothetical protein